MTQLLLIATLIVVLFWSCNKDKDMISDHTNNPVDTLVVDTTVIEEPIDTANTRRRYYIYFKYMDV